MKNINDRVDNLYASRNITYTPWSNNDSNTTWATSQLVAGSSYKFNEYNFILAFITVHGSISTTLFMPTGEFLSRNSESRYIYIQKNNSVSNVGVAFYVIDDNHVKYKWSEGSIGLSCYIFGAFKI